MTRSLFNALTRNTTRPRSLGVVTLGAILAAASMPVSVASAQNALGDGRALDNSLSTRGRVNTPRPSLRDEFAFRNSIVTGNAPNGMSFRGDVGYRAPGEFTGELGSNDLFSFRRDSLQSGMAGMGIRGTEALQYQYALTTGSQPPANLVGRFSVSRSGTTPDAGNVASRANPGTINGGLVQRPAIDPDADDRGTMLWMLRSPSAYISNSSLQTSALRRIEGEGGNVYTLTASPLRGVRLSPIPELTAQRQAQIEAEEEAQQERNTRSPFGRVDSRLDDQENTGSALNRENTRDNTRQPPETRGQQEDDSRIGTLHSDLITRISERDRKLRASQDDVFGRSPTMAERMKSMMDRLTGAREEAEEAARAEAENSETDTPRGEDEADEYQSESSGRLRFDSETMQLLRGDGTRLSRFVDPEAAARNVYAEHLREGQELLANGRYFDAEERFASALGIRRGDVTAQIGRLHAQIGAGLYLSASLNLQTLAANRPEVFAARYASTLLPKEDRLEDVITVLQELIDDSSAASLRASPQVRQSAGVLLGYLGYQLERPDLVEQGMTDFRERATRGMEPGDPLPPEARLGDLLTQLWTTEEGDD